MSEYKPLFVYLEPASIPQVVARIQKYLSENPIISDEETIAELIREYIAAHPEIIAVASVNGKVGAVVLTGSDIMINPSSAVSVETQLLNLASMINNTGADITRIEANISQIYTDIGTLQTNVKTNASNISALQTSVEGQGTRLATAETDIDNLESAQTAQGTRINSAEGNIMSLQTRMTQAETDIDNLETAQETIKTRLESGIVEKTGGIAQIISKNTDGTSSAMHVDANSDNPWFTRYVAGGSTVYKGIVTAGAGIQNTEFEKFDVSNLIGLTFWTSPTTYYRLLLGINGNKSLFMEYYDGSTTSRIWTGTVT